MLQKPTMPKLPFAQLDRDPTRQSAPARRVRRASVWIAALAVAAMASPSVALEPNEVAVIDSASARLGIVDLGTGQNAALSQGGELSTPLGVALEASGDFLVVDSSADAVVRIDGETGDQSVVAQGSPLSSPVSIAIEPDGNALIADLGARALIRVDVDSGDMVVLADQAPLSQPFGVAVSPQGAIFVSDRAQRAVLSVDRTTGTATLLSLGASIDEPNGLVWVAGTGEFGDALLLADEGLPGVIEIATSDGAQRIVSQAGNFIRPTGVAVDSDGNALVVDPTSNRLVQVERESGTQLVIATTPGFSDPFGVVAGAALPPIGPDPVVLEGGDAIVADPEEGALVRIEAGSGMRSPLLGEEADPSLLGAPVDVLLRKSDRSIWWIDSEGPSVRRLDRATGALVSFQSPSLAGPESLALGPDGQIYIADPVAASILRVDEANTTVVPFKTGPPLVSPIALAPRGDAALVVADEATGALLGVALPGGGISLVASGGLMDAPRDVIELESGALLVLDPGANALIEVDADGGTQTAIETGLDLTTARDLAEASGGRIFIADGEDGGVLVVDLETGGSDELAPDDAFANASGIDVEPPAFEIPTGDLFFVDDLQAAVVRFRPSDGTQEVVASGGFLITPTGVAIDDRDRLVVTDSDADAVVRIDLETGEQELVASGGELFSPAGIVVDEDGSLLVADTGAGAVLRIDPGTGFQQIVASGDPLVAPYGIAIEASGSLAISDLGARGVLRIDPVGGTAERLSSPTKLIGAPFEMVVAPDGTLFVVDGGSGSLLSVDPESGDVVSLSQAGALAKPRGLAFDEQGRLLVTDEGVVGSGDPIVLRFEPEMGEAGELVPVVEADAFGDPVGLVIAVPEPHTLWLATIALLVLWGLVRVAAHREKTRSE